LGVADSVIQEHGLAGVRVDEQGAPEGRGMKGEAVCGQLFSATATANRQHKKSAHGNEMAIS
jgi:hypothetical protein